MHRWVEEIKYFYVCAELIANHTAWQFSLPVFNNITMHTKSCLCAANQPERDFVRDFAYSLIGLSPKKKGPFELYNNEHKVGSEVNEKSSIRLTCFRSIFNMEWIKMSLSPRQPIAEIVRRENLRSKQRNKCTKRNNRGRERERDRDGEKAKGEKLERQHQKLHKDLTKIYLILCCTTVHRDFLSSHTL